MKVLLPVGRSGWAIAAGYAALFCLVIVPGPIALILGLIALRDIIKHPENGGRGRASLAIVAGSLATIVLAWFTFVVATR